MGERSKASKSLLRLRSTYHSHSSNSSTANHRISSNTKRWSCAEGAGRNQLPSIARTVAAALQRSAKSLSTPTPCSAVRSSAPRIVRWRARSGAVTRTCLCRVSGLREVHSQEMSSATSRNPSPCPQTENTHMTSCEFVLLESEGAHFEQDLNAVHCSYNCNHSCVKS